MNILLTGGAGFIGSHIADRYISEGHKVIIVDNLTSGFKKNVNSNAIFYNIDICSKKLKFVFEKHKIDLINHHAAQIDLRKSISNPDLDAYINIFGSLNLLKFAKEFQVKKFIFASTGGAVYGEQKYFPADENHITNPISPYGLSKLTVEKYLDFYFKFYKMNYVCLRYSNAYGPRQNSKGETGVISIFCNKILKNKEPIINGSGKNTRDFIFVYDIVDANLKALKLNKPTTVNISTGIETNINFLFRSINEIYGNKSKEIHLNEIKGEQKRSVLSNNKAKRLLGWKPKYNIVKGLELTCKYFENK